MKIQLDKEYNLKSGFRVFMMWEEICEKPISEMSTNLKDVLTLFYCAIKADKTNDFLLSFDEFVDLLDNYQDKIVEFNKFIESSQDSDKKK